MKSRFGRLCFLRCRVVILDVQLCQDIENVQSDLGGLVRRTTISILRPHQTSIRQDPPGKGSRTPHAFPSARQEGRTTRHRERLGPRRQEVAVRA